MTSKLWLLLAIPILLKLLKRRPLPPREARLPFEQERVLLLGASSGVGRDLALVYAKRGSRICLVARRQTELEKVREECIALGLDAEKVIMFAGDVSNTSDLISIRDVIYNAWEGLDTLHILAGLPSTLTLLGQAGVDLSPVPSSRASYTGIKRRDFHVGGATFPDVPGGIPTKEGLDVVAADARKLSEVNYVGTLLALTCFLPLLSATSKSPVVHHLSSVAAGITPPHRVVYGSTKGAALIAMEAARVECEGCGVRFFSLLPGTINNDFRLKLSTSGQPGRDETKMSSIKSGLESLLLSPETVVKTIFTNLSLNPAPQPLIPYPPFSWFRSLDVPPNSTQYIPSLYTWAKLMTFTPLGYLYVEPRARVKYGLPRW
ncbi:hypothetical protein M231_05265 [Tremella mesenterica]|uniref:NAD(P)-binding protein n=1 Tax=Tremella mesenterica TaxID=5217 RepID=A0A4Q1BIM3_TREME|nr:hypothetical protein M231_05265 [Tremella mesenterica]